jgi:DNA-binding response OmpR family regulator
MITWKLAQAGYATLSAEDGDTALQMVAAGGRAGHSFPDLVLADWMMPRITGIEVCRAIRDDPLTAHIPIILLTAKAQGIEIERGFAVGADDYIVKPFSLRAMVDQVAAVLARCEARTTLAVGHEPQPRAPA